MIRVGCSGFYYPNWRNKFYPPRLPQKDWLTYYSSVFNTVELNGTFYRLPKPADLKRYFQITPDDFTFSVKMSRYITHVKRLTIKESISMFQDLVLENLEHKLQHFLFQFPSNFRYNSENLEQIVTSVPNRPQSVVELRHESWWNDDVEKTLTQATITFANIDYPGLESYVVSTSAAFYFRLHGNPVLFASSYSNEELKKILQQVPRDCATANVYFNNTMEEAGFRNAAQFMSLLKEDQRQ